MSTMRPSHYSDTSQSVSTDRSKFETCYLLSHQKSIRLRHLTQIVGFNLQLPEGDFPKNISPLPASNPLGKLKSGFYFTLSINKNYIIYTSEFQSGRHPTWEAFDLKQNVDFTVHALQGVIVRIWLKKDEKAIPIVSWGVDFSGLIPIGHYMGDLPDGMAENTIIFRLMGWLYTSPDCLPRASSNPSKVPLFKSFSLPLSQTKCSFSVSTLMGLKTKKKERLILEKKMETQIRDYDVESHLKHPRLEELLGAIDVSRMLVSRLKKQVDIELKKLTSTKQKMDECEGFNQDKVSMTLENIRIMNRELSLMKKEHEYEKEDRKKFEELIRKLSNRRRQLISDLSHIYPITEDPSNKGALKICDVHLPLAEQYTGCSDQALSVAIGYTAHLLTKVSSLLYIPLPFPINLYGSQCTITDKITISLHDRNQKFQLYSRGKDRERTFFCYGVFLLNKNIAQIRWNCGLPSRDLRPTLLNIRTLLDSLCGRSMIPPIAYFPDLSIECPLYSSSIIAQLKEISRDEPSDPEDILQNGRTRLSLSDKEPSVCDSPIKIKICKKIPEEICVSLDEGLDRIGFDESKEGIVDSASVSELNLKKDQLPGPFLSSTNSLYGPLDKTPELDDEHRRMLDESFDDVMKKYFLKRSNSEDRISGLKARVPDLSESETDSTPTNLNTIEKSSETLDFSSENSSKINTPLTRSALDVNKTSMDGELITTSELSDVFSRTKALASQNFSFKLFKENSESS